MPRHSGITGQESDSVSSFMDDLSKYKHLPREEEQRLAVIISTAPLDEDGKPSGDEAREAIGKLVLHNMKFAAKCAKRYSHRGVPMDDLISATVPNMVRAAEKFKPGRGKFISYATWWIRIALQECVSKESRPVDLPYHAASMIFGVMRQLEKDYRETGRCVLDAAELSEKTGRPLRDIEPAIALMRPPVSMEPSDNHPDKWFNPDAEAPDAIAQHLDNVRVIELLLVGLSKPQRDVIDQIYFGGRAPVDIAGECGVSRQAIGARLENAIYKARVRAEKLKKAGVL